MTGFLTKDSDEFGTPDWLFERLNSEFHFTIDAAASKHNHKLPNYWTKEDNALLRLWSTERVFCNPPFSRGNVKAFFLKAYEETRVSGSCQLAVLLLPTYTDRDWYNMYRPHFEARFIPQRLKFIGGETGARGNHMIVIFRRREWAWWSPV